MLKVVVKVELTSHIVEIIDVDCVPIDKDLDFILRAVSYVLKIPIADIKSKSREGELPDARKLYCLFAREYTKKTLREIGELVNIDHATVTYASKQARILMNNEINFKNKYDSIKIELYLR